MIKLKFICANINCPIFTIEFEINEQSKRYTTSKDYNICPHCKQKLEVM